MSTKTTTPAVATQPNGNGAKPARTANNSVIVRMAEKFQMDPVAFERTIKATCVPPGKAGEVTNEQFAAFLIVADQHGLNPLTKEIYAFPAKSGGIVPIVGIDGWYKLANGHPLYDGIQYHDEVDSQGLVISITARVYRKDRAHPIEATEYMRECHRSTEPWRQWPRRMLRHKATIQALRAAFGFAGIYDPDEAERIVEAHAVERVVETSAANLGELTERLEADRALPAKEEPRAVEVEFPSEEEAEQARGRQASFVGNEQEPD